MQSRNLWIIGALGLTTIVLLGTNYQTAQAQQAKPVLPTVAMQAAAKKAGGTPFSATYAKEGDKWLYDVILIKNGKVVEVEVDALTGKAGDTESATPEMEGKELTAALTRAIGGKPTPVEKASDEKDEKDEAKKP